MLYNQPGDQPSNPSAPYVDGNPSAGIQGSIVPAAGVEFDQREIVAVIQWAFDHGFRDYAGALCATPSNSDLTQLLKAIFGIMNSRYLTAPQTYYVNTATGNDANNGLTPTTAFKTLQRAANQSTLYNLNGFNVTINVADGIYGQVQCGMVNGSGGIYFVGNTAVPLNCKIHANLGPAVITAGQSYYFNGFRYESDAPDITHGYPGAGIWSIPGGVVYLTGTNEFGACSDAHLCASHGTIGLTGNLRIAGNSAAHLLSGANGWITFYYLAAALYPTLVIPAAQSLSYFANAQSSGFIQPRYASITGAANITGQKYLAQVNGVIDTGGAGVNFLPGTIAGTTVSGGQYT